MPVKYLPMEVKQMSFCWLCDQAGAAYPSSCQGTITNWVYETLVGKEAANVRRDPLQRVRDEGVPTGGFGVEQ